MRNAVLCVGNYAKQPYTFQKIGVKVYCVEELCYCLGENAYLLDHAIVSKELVDWIDKQCGLTQLAGELNGLINHQASESAFVGTILQYVGYQTEEEIHHIETVLSEGASMDAGEKRKARADYFLKTDRSGRQCRNTKRWNGRFHMKTEQRETGRILPRYIITEEYY